ncbi:ParB/RepB/Spo0J family partition protein [Streptomyces sp. KLOTTS4A1]|uniref:ParB/RepB/Spo0J family partition protein n=1 Tax=Streptomyces sp. KLOTTS4A1 TaxID=3390996 RepID=UPI0039F50D2E
MSTKKERLGAGASFGNARPVSARRAAITGATKAPTVGVPQPTELPLHLISANPDNPRESLGELDGLAASLAEIGQIQAITVAALDAYLASRPERAHELDEGATHVVVDGHRRLAAAREAGLATVKVTLNDGLASTDESLLEAAFVANFQREDLSDLEEAQALKKLVDFYGSQRQAAKRLGITQAKISQRLSLLALAPELQADLEAGRRKVEHVRGLAKLSAVEQRAAADDRALKADQEKAQRKARQTSDSPSGDNAVITPAEPEAPTGGEGRGDNAVITPRAPEPVTEPNGMSDNAVITTPPEKQPDSPRGARPGKPSSDAVVLPWNNPQALNRIAREHMTSENRTMLAKLLAQD